MCRGQFSAVSVQLSITSTNRHLPAIELSKVSYQTALLVFTATAARTQLVSANLTGLPVGRRHVHGQTSSQHFSQDLFHLLVLHLGKIKIDAEAN